MKEYLSFYTSNLWAVWVLKSQKVGQLWGEMYSSTWRAQAMAFWDHIFQVRYISERDHGCKCGRNSCSPSTWKIWPYRTSEFIVRICFSFVQAMASWESIFGREASMSEIIIAGVFSWKHSWKIRCHQTFELIARADTATLWSARDKCFWNFMSSLYIVLFCNFLCNYLM